MTCVLLYLYCFMSSSLYFFIYILYNIAWLTSKKFKCDLFSECLNGTQIHQITKLLVFLCFALKEEEAENSSQVYYYSSFSFSLINIFFTSFQLKCSINLQHKTTTTRHCSIINAMQSNEMYFTVCAFSSLASKYVNGFERGIQFIYLQLCKLNIKHYC